MVNNSWEEIHGFSSLSEYKKFVQYIEKQINDGYVLEKSPDMKYGYGEIYGGRWFENINSGDVWRLVPPDFPFRGVWEPIKSKE